MINEEAFKNNNNFIYLKYKYIFSLLLNVGRWNDPSNRIYIMDIIMTEFSNIYLNVNVHERSWDITILFIVKMTKKLIEIT